MSAEAKLGKSLDSIIEENRKVVSKKPRKGIRVDGPRKGLKGTPLRQRQAETNGTAQQKRGGSGARLGLGVKGAGIQKKSRRPEQAYDMDEEMEDVEYGQPAPRQPRRARQPFVPRTTAGQGPRIPPRGRPAPRGNPEDTWTHDLYDDSDSRPPRRMAGQFGGPSGRAGGPNSSQLLVSNLDYTVTEQDIQELFSTCGQVVKSFIHYDVSGRSEGTATVIYNTRAEAQAAIREYNGVQLDNKQLKIEFAPEEGQQGNVMARLSSGKSISRPAGPGAGFQRAIQDAAPISTGRMGGPSGRMAAGGSGNGIARGGFRGPRGRGGGRLRSGVVTKTHAELDAEMDGYMQE